MSTAPSPTKIIAETVAAPHSTIDTAGQDVKPSSEHAFDLKSEHVETSDGNLHYENDDEEPELHARTYVAVGSVVAFTIAGLLSLQGPPAVVCTRSQDHTSNL